MTDKQIILISNNNVAVYYCQGARIVFSRTCNEFQQHTEVIEFFKYTTQVPCYFLLDLIEEDYKRETIPHVAAWERSALIQRKLHKIFRDTEFCHAQWQGREKHGRRDDRILATAIINPELLTYWLQLLKRHKIQLAGMVSMASLSGKIIQRIKSAKGHLLLITQNQLSGVRHSFFNQGKLQLSRLSPTNNWQQAHLTKLLDREIEKTQRYINSLRLVAPNETLNVCVLASAEQSAQWRQHFSDSQHVKFQFLSLPELAQSLKLPHDSGPYAENFLIQCFLKFKPNNQYARNHNLAHYQHYLAGKTLKYAATLVALVLLLLSGKNWLDSDRLQQESQANSQMAAQLQMQLLNLSAQLPQTRLDAKQTKSVVEISQRLREQPYQPGEILQLIGTKLLAYPAIKLNHIRWETDIDPDVGLSDKEISLPGVSAQALRIADEDNGIKARYQVVTLIGEIQPFVGDYRQAINIIDDFSAHIKQIKICRWITPLKLPIDLALEAKISADIAAQKNQKALFVLRLIFRENHGQNQA